MANVLSEEKRQQVIVLGRLGWTLRRIEESTGVRRETASAYLKTAEIAVRPQRGRRLPPKPASQVSTDSKPASRVSTDPGRLHDADAVGRQLPSVALAVALSAARRAVRLRREDHLVVVVGRAAEAGDRPGGGVGEILAHVDLVQHPPELVPTLIDHWQDGYDLVLTQRMSNQDETFIQRTLNRAFYWVLNLLSDFAIPEKTPDFRLLDRKYVDTLKSMKEMNRMFRGLVSWLGVRNTKTVLFDAPGRHAGSSKYGLKELWLLAMLPLFLISGFEA